jgi:hypothetical protein
MKDRVEGIREKYKAFRKGEESVLALKDETQLLLEEARKKGRRKVVEELEDILIDLKFSIEDNKCKCHRNSSI